MIRRSELVESREREYIASRAPDHMANLDAFDMLLEHARALGVYPPRHHGPRGVAHKSEWLLRVHRSPGIAPYRSDA